jgi:Skp family chaperone for outer membrane proteins
MDSSQETANRANIKTARLTVWILALTALLAVVGILTLLLLFYPPTSQAPPANQESAFMVSTLVIVLSSSLTLAAISLFIAAFRLLKLKRLKANLKTANAAFADMEERVEKLKEELTTSQRDAKNETKRANYEESQRDQFIKLNDEARRELADLAWLRQLADEQGKNISEHVVITAVKPGRLKLAASPRCVTIGLVIRNESIFDITIRAENVKGRLFFKTRPLDEPARVLLDSDRPPIENLKPMQKEILVVEQPLRVYEAETISEADEEARFWLGNLSIPISVESVPQQVETKDVRIRAEVEHLYLKTFGKQTAAASADTPHPMLTRQQLLQEIEALPPADRASATKAALEIFGESLYDQDTNARK